MNGVNGFTGTIEKGLRVVHILFLLDENMLCTFPIQAPWWRRSHQQIRE